MNQTNEIMDCDVVEFGKVSVETKGGSGPKIEDLGFVTMPGIADE